VRINLGFGTHYSSNQRLNRPTAPGSAPDDINGMKSIHAPLRSLASQAPVPRGGPYRLCKPEPSSLGGLRVPAGGASSGSAGPR